VADAVIDGIEQRCGDVIASSGETVVDPQPIFSGVDEASPSEVGEVPGHQRLRKSQGFVDVADANLSAAKQSEDSNPCRIGESLEDLIDSLEITFHMCLDKYSMLRIR